MKVGRFTRSINVLPHKNYTNEEISNNISSYIQIFDKLVKGYVSGAYSPRDLEMTYLEYYNKGVGLI